MPPNNRTALLSLIQYMPDPIAGEGINAGVLLSTPDGRSFVVRLSDRLTRLRNRLVHSKKVDYSALKWNLSGIREQFLSIKPKSHDEFARFGSRLTGGWSIGLVREVTVESTLEEVADTYFARAVESEPAHRKVRNSTKVKGFTKAFKELSARRPEIRPADPVIVPEYEVPFEADYSFRNGSAHLIKQRRFDSLAPRLMQTVEDIASRSLMLSQKADTHLWLIVDFTRQQNSERVINILRAHQAKVFVKDKIRDAVAEVESILDSSHV